MRLLLNREWFVGLGVIFLAFFVKWSQVRLPAIPHSCNDTGQAGHSYVAGKETIILA